jgi:hypothetical protein
VLHCAPLRLNPRRPTASFVARRNDLADREVMDTAYPQRREPSQVKIYIDTNWFLSFYQSNHERRNVLEAVVAKSNLILLTEQNITEFRRNRSALLGELRDKVAKSTRVLPYTTSLLIGMEEHKRLLALADEISAASDALVQKLESIEASHDFEDEVLRAFNEIVSRCTVIPVRDDDVAKAQRRKARGIPPSSNKRDTIGDELIWECILRGWEEDLAIVSLDGDFVRHQDILGAEFAAHPSHRNLVYCGMRVSEALKKFGSLTAETYKEEYGRDPWARCDTCGGGDWQYAGKDEEEDRTRFLCGNCRAIILVV